MAMGIVGMDQTKQSGVGVEYHRSGRELIAGGSGDGAG